MLSRYSAPECMLESGCRVNYNKVTKLQKKIPKHQQETIPTYIKKVIKKLCVNYTVPFIYIFTRRVWFGKIPIDSIFLFSSFAHRHIPTQIIVFLKNLGSVTLNRLEKQLTNILKMCLII